MTDVDSAGRCIVAHWTTQKGYCQERWEYLFDPGALSAAVCDRLADVVWPPARRRAR